MIRHICVIRNRHWKGFRSCAVVGGRNGGIPAGRWCVFELKLWVFYAVSIFSNGTRLPLFSVYHIEHCTFTRTITAIKHGEKQLSEISQFQFFATHCHHTIQHRSLVKSTWCVPFAVLFHYQLYQAFPLNFTAPVETMNKSANCNWIAIDWYFDENKQNPSSFNMRRKNCALKLAKCRYNFYSHSLQCSLCLLYRSHIRISIAEYSIRSDKSSTQSKPINKQKDNN